MADYRKWARFAHQRAPALLGNDIYYISNLNGRPDLWRAHVRVLPSAVHIEYEDQGLMAAATSEAVSSFSVSRHRSPSDVLVQVVTRGADERQTLWCIAEGEPRRVEAPHLVRIGEAGLRPSTAESPYLSYRHSRFSVSLVDILTHTYRFVVDLERRAPPPIPMRWINSEKLLLRAIVDNTASKLYVLNIHSGDLKQIAPSAPVGFDEVVEGGFSGNSNVFLSDRFGEHRQLVAEDAVTTSQLRCVSNEVVDVECAVRIPMAAAVAYIASSGDGISRLKHSGRSGEVKTLMEAHGVLADLTVDDSGTLLAFTRATPTHPPELLVRQLNGVGLMTDQREQEDGEKGSLDLACRTEAASGVCVWPGFVSLSTSSGDDVHLLVYRPPGPGPHPTVLSFPGGPEAQERPDYSYNGMYAALNEVGIAVVGINSVGRTGYGKTFRNKLYGGWGRVDVEAVGKVLEFVADDPSLDQSCVSLWGTSYGGFLALLVASRFTPIRAVATHGAPLDLEAMLREARGGWRTMLNKWIGEARIPYIQAISPSNLMTRNWPPLLIVHGRADVRVPISQAENFVQKAKKLGIDAELWITEGGHGSPDNAEWVALHERVTNFLEWHCIRASG